MIKWIKRLFGVYETGTEYLVNIRDIKIQADFKKTRIGKEKFKRKMQYYHTYGICESAIVLDKNFTLIDGYSSYQIYRRHFGNYAKIPVYFDFEK